MNSRWRNLFVLPLLLLAGCRAIATLVLLPFVALAWVATIFIGSEGLTNQDELRASGIRVDAYVADYRIASDLTYAATLEVRRTVTGPAGLADAQEATQNFDPRTQTLELVSAEVIHPDGSRATVAADQVFTRPSTAAKGAPSFVSTLTKTVLFPQLRVGSQTHVTWKFTESGQSILGFNCSWRPSFALPVTEARLRFEHPTDVPLRVEGRAPFAIARHVDGEHTVVEATLRDYVGQTPERTMVAPRDLTPIIVATTTKSWEEIGARFHEAIADKVESTPEITALAAKIVGERKGVDAARAIHRWVCANVQYVAVYLNQMSGWVPNSASVVLKNGYGDCKDQYVLLASLLGARGIAVEPVLVAYDRSFTELPLPTPQQFDHCLAYLPEFDLYSNPIDPYRDLGELETTLAGKFAVVATSTGRTTRTPSGSADRNRYRLEQKVAIAADGTVSGHSTLDVAGPQAGRFRRSLVLAASPEQAADDLLSSTRIGGTGELKTTSPTDLDVPLRATGEWKGDVPLAMGKSLRFATPIGLDLFDPSVLLHAITGKERRHPSLLGAREIAWHHEIQLPAGFAFTALPEGRRAQNAAGRFQSSYVVGADGRLVVERVLRIERDVYPAADYASLREILVTASSDLQTILSAEMQP